MRKPNLIILSSVSLIALGTAPAFAQSTSAAPAEAAPQEAAQLPPSEPAQDEAKSENDIVVTGSRIRRDNFATPQNVDIFTRNDQILAGARSTTEILQSATVTSGTSQVSGSFLGFLSEGGQGANVVGLRGLGSSRTLLLLNGRRLAPAGVGPQLVSADLNVLPTAIVQRIEVLREGASSIYGSDAIAGVINIITDTKMNGLTVDAFSDVPEIGAGNTYRISVTGGKTFERGHITAAFEYREDKGLRLGDRDIYSCPRELAFIGGKEIGQASPDDPNKLRCFPFERQAIGTAVGYGLGYTGFTDGNSLLGFSFAGRQGLRNGSINTPPLNVDNYDLRPLSNPIALQDTVFTPIKTYTAYVNGAYELGVLGDTELYGEALFSRRQSRQKNSTQINFQNITNFGEAQLYGGNLTNLGAGPATVPCADVFGSACSPFYPTAWADSGINYYSPFVVPNRTFQQSQDVDFFRGNVGLRGSTGIGDWRFDANAMFSRTRSKSTIQNPLTERVGNILVAVDAPANTPAQYITRGLPGQVGAGNNYTCAANVTAGAYNGGTCVPINFFDPAVLTDGQLSSAFYDYLYANSTGRTRYDQDTFSLVFDGSLFSLPGGPVKAAIGFEHRRDKIVDTPSPERMSGQLYGYGTAAITKGSDRVNEAFAELQLPILKDRPFFHSLEFSASGRYTHYKSYGSGWTYALKGEWAPISNIRFRGNYGTNFRAPNLYEQFVADEIGFYPGGLDPCDEFSTKYSSTNTVYKNCLAELTPILDNPATPQNEALGYFTSGSIQVTTTGGRGRLKAEKAKTWGLGTVLSAPKDWGDFSLAIDYWNVEVKGEVSTLGNLILDFCYQADDFPNNPYCGFLNGRITDSQDPGFGQISSFRNPYLNISRQRAQGIDLDARYATDLFGGRFQTQLQATRMLKQQLEYFDGDGLNDFNGQLGYPGAGAGPKLVASLDTRFTTKSGVTFRWGVEYVGKAEDKEDPFFLTANGDVCDENIPGNCVPVDYDLVAEPYWEHGVSVQWLWKDIGQVTIGVNNLFNEKPPTISAHPTNNAPRLGNTFANGPYDYRGRSFFINVTRSF